MANRPERPQRDRGDLNLGGVLNTINGFFEMLSNLSEENGAVERSGELTDKDGRVRGVYGFSVRVGAGGPPKVEPFGNIKVGAGGPKVEATREPLIDLFDEGDCVVVVAELPGVGADDIHVEVHGDVLELKATRGERKYYKELLLPAAVDEAQGRSSYRNGVFEIRFPKKA